MKQGNILLSHGAGGKLSHNLIKSVLLPKLNNPILSQLKDSGIFTIGKNKYAFTTDSYVISPIFFPGGDIGKLAVCGTVNDLAVVGAKPLYISLSLIIEEGFEMQKLTKIISSIEKASKEAQVKVITGDTKVVEKGNCDKIFINTSGLGIIKKPLSYKIKRGDKIIVSGTLGDHYISILSQRENLSFSTKVKSDCAPLNHLVEDIMGAGKILWMRDPTRGGVATSLCELVKEQNISCKIYESKIPIKKEVRSVCEMMGYDVLYLANEGKLLAVVDRQDAENVLKTIRKNKYGKDAEIIGEVIHYQKSVVLLETLTGGIRLVDMLSGEQLPRIC